MYPYITILVFPKLFASEGLTIFFWKLFVEHARSETVDNIVPAVFDKEHTIRLSTFIKSDLRRFACQRRSPDAHVKLTIRVDRWKRKFLKRYERNETNPLSDFNQRVGCLAWSSSVGVSTVIGRATLSAVPGADGLDYESKCRGSYVKYSAICSLSIRIRRAYWSHMSRSVSARNRLNDQICR